MTNLLVVMADDMRFDHLRYMSEVRTRIVDRGRSFVQARCNLALCQPNRVSLLTGQSSLHHGETGVGLAGIDWDDHDNTVAAWLSEAGYRCGMFGKYVNFYDEFGGIPGPRGWATWREYGRERAVIDFDHRSEGDEVTRVTGVYPTEWLADQACEFVAGEEPWFCYVAPKQPHAPAAPHPDDLHAWSDQRCEIVEHDDVASKPFWIRDSPALVEANRSRIQQDFRGRLRELSAVDRMVGSILDAVEAAGALDDTVVIFTSDNGVHQGEQRRLGDGTKGGPYEPALHVPVVVAGPGFAPGPDITVPVYPAADITATAVDVAGATAGLPHQAGISLRTLVADPGAHRDRVLLHEIGEGFPVTGDGISTGPDHELGHVKLFRYPSRRVGGDVLSIEAYDLAADPTEAVNIARDRARRPLVEDLLRLLDDTLGA